MTFDEFWLSQTQMVTVEDHKLLRSAYQAGWDAALEQAKQEAASQDKAYSQTQFVQRLGDVLRANGVNYRSVGLSVQHDGSYIVNVYHGTIISRKTTTTTKLLTEKAVSTAVAAAFMKG